MHIAYIYIYLYIFIRICILVHKTKTTVQARTQSHNGGGKEHDKYNIMLSWIRLDKKYYKHYIVISLLYLINI